MTVYLFLHTLGDTLVSAGWDQRSGRYEAEC